ncbi:uncharacterized protein BJ171DRAFT_595260, partial [Polychytrium aggregatum]|uniref:uncharacterized protein n=1 Tax=Polychytrium aggregatum TaxID=110093 RepID=UPI0022FEEAE0
MTRGTIDVTRSTLFLGLRFRLRPRAPRTVPSSPSTPETEYDMDIGSGTSETIQYIVLGIGVAGQILCLLYAVKKCLKIKTVYNYLML